MEFPSSRLKMVKEQLITRGIKDQRVLTAMRKIPRHLFVPEALRSKAYGDHPLPIGEGQTISQPYMVAFMVETLELKGTERVLEIGTGSGYQAAVLAELGVEVFTLEIIGPLATQAEARLSRLGYTSIHVRHADGYYGWPDEGPFDAIIVTAAPDHVPQPLLKQLGIGGVLVIPVGPVGGYQELWKITLREDGTAQSMSLGGVRFVPLTREEAP